MDSRKSTPNVFVEMDIKARKEIQYHIPDDLSVSTSIAERLPTSDSSVYIRSASVVHIRNASVVRIRSASGDPGPLH